MNMKQIWGMAGGFFIVYVLITLTNRPAVEPKKREASTESQPVQAANDTGNSNQTAPQTPSDGRFRGFTVIPADGKQLGSAETVARIQEVAGAGASSVALAPVLIQPTGRSAEVPSEPTADLLVEDARAAVKAAKAAGLTVLLRPVVRAESGSSEPITPPAAGAWLDSYKRALTPYLTMAEAEHVDLFCLGVRLGATLGEDGWKKLIEAARNTYHGKLTYAASHADVGNYKEVKFWNDLDLVGIEAMFPLADGNSPKPEELEAGWSRVDDDLDAWRTESGIDKPILFTVAGVPAQAGGATHPDHTDSSAATDEQVQAAAYEAFFKTTWNKGWLAGVYWHTWEGAVGVNDPYGVKGHPALAIIRTGFSAGGGSATNSSSSDD